MRTAILIGLLIITNYFSGDDLTMIWNRCEIFIPFFIIFIVMDIYELNRGNN